MYTIVYSGVHVFRIKYFFETRCTKFPSIEIWGEVGFIRNVYSTSCTHFLYTLWPKNAVIPGFKESLMFKFDNLPRFLQELEKKHLNQHPLKILIELLF